MTHYDLVSGLGTAFDVAEWMTRQSSHEVKPDTVYKWRQKGVPWRWRPLVAKLAKQRRMDIPKDFLSGMGG